MARLERHYGDGSDNPAWVSLEGGAERYLPGLGSDLGVQMTTIPVGAGDTVMGVSAWSDYTEYGTPPRDQTTLGVVEGVAGYGCLGGKERSTPAGTLGLNLMGARLYNPTTGRFLTPDYVSGGNPNTYTYPVDLLTDKQTTRLTALFAAEDHVEVEATWGIYRRIIHAYRHPTGQPAASR